MASLVKIRKKEKKKTKEKKKLRKTRSFSSFLWMLKILHLSCEFIFFFPPLHPNSILFSSVTETGAELLKFKLGKKGFFLLLETFSLCWWNQIPPSHIWIFPVFAALEPFRSGVDFLGIFWGSFWCL